MGDSAPQVCQRGALDVERLGERGAPISRLASAGTMVPYSAAMTTGSQPSEPSDRSNSNPADVINGALVQQAATLHQQTARESPLFASFFTGPGAAREFATLVHRLIVHQGRLHGFKVESGPAGPGRGWVVCGSGFLGFQGNTP